MLRSNDKGTNTFRKITRESYKCLEKTRNKELFTAYHHFRTYYKSVQVIASNISLYQNICYLCYCKQNTNRNYKQQQTIKASRIMSPKIDFNDVPKNYLYCTHSECPRRNQCLRYQATLCIPQNVSDFRTVNPNHIIGNENNCRFFNPYFTLCLWNRPYFGQHTIFYSCRHPQRIIFFDGAQHVLPHPQQRTDDTS